MDVSQWECYDLRTDGHFGDAQSISLRDLLNRSKQYGYSELRQGVRNLTRLPNILAINLTSVLANHTMSPRYITDGL